MVENRPEFQQAPTRLIESKLSQETSQAIKAVKKGFTRLITEQRTAEREAIGRYHPSREKLMKIGQRFGRRGANLLIQAGVDYWTFHQALLQHESVERQKTGKPYTDSTWILFWAMGQEAISGHSGN